MAWVIVSLRISWNSGSDEKVGRIPLAFIIFLDDFEGGVLTYCLYVCWEWGR